MDHSRSPGRASRVTGFPRSSGDAGALELVTASPFEHAECTVEVIDAAAFYQPDEHCFVALDEGRDTEHRPALDRLGVLDGQRLGWTAACHLVGDVEGVDTDARDCFVEQAGVENLAVVMALREHGDMEI